MSIRRLLLAVYITSAHSINSPDDLKRRVAAKILTSIRSGKLTSYTDDLNSEEMELLRSIPVRSLDSITFDTAADAMREAVGEHMFALVSRAAENYAARRISRSLQMVCELQSVYPRSRWSYQVNHDGCNDSLILTEKSAGQKLFIKSCKIGEEALMNAFVSSVLSRACGRVIATDTLVRIASRTYLVSGDVADTPSPHHTQRTGYDYYKDQSLRISDKEGLLMLGMMWAVLRLADGHGHNIVVLSADGKDRVVAIDLELHRVPTPLRSRRPGEPLPQYIYSNIQKNYNNTSIRYLFRRFVLEDSVDEQTVARVFRKIDSRVSLSNRPEPSFAALLSDAIASITCSESPASEKEFVASMIRAIPTWEKNYSVLKGSIASSHPIRCP